MPPPCLGPAWRHPGQPGRLRLSHPSRQQQVEAEKRPSNALDEPVSHWRPRLTLNVMVDDFVFDGAALPADVHRYMKMYVPPSGRPAEDRVAGGHRGACALPEPTARGRRWGGGSQSRPAAPAPPLP